MWPEGETFGSVEVEPEEELELLKQILFTKLPSKITILYYITVPDPITNNITLYNLPNTIIDKTAVYCFSRHCHKQYYTVLLNLIEW